jgi:hypothetical protein
VHVVLTMLSFHRIRAILRQLQLLAVDRIGAVGDKWLHLLTIAIMIRERKAILVLN